MNIEKKAALYLIATGIQKTAGNGIASAATNFTTSKRKNIPTDTNSLGSMVGKSNVTQPAETPAVQDEGNQGAVVTKAGKLGYDIPMNADVWNYMTDAQKEQYINDPKRSVTGIPIGDIQRFRRGTADTRGQSLAGWFWK